MRIVGYVRVSSTEQVRNGQGIPVQTEAIESWAKAHGHKLVAIYSDGGVSGAKEVDQRDGLALALEAIRDRRADAVVTLNLLRLARAVTVQEATLATIWRLGGALWTVESGEVMADDPDDPMRTAMRQMAGVFAELDRRMLVKRLNDGRRHKAAAGGFAAFGSPTYGKRSVGGVLVADDREAPALARIRELHAEGKSLRAIAATLTEEGHKPKRSDRWHPQTLAKIVARFDTTKAPT